MMQPYYHDSFEKQLWDEFLELTDHYPQIRFFQPNAEKAPWHVQAILDTPIEPIVLNFWPHKCKGQRMPLRSVEGMFEIYALVDEAIADRQALEEDAQAFDVLDDSDDFDLF